MIYRIYIQRSNAAVAGYLLLHSDSVSIARLYSSELFGIERPMVARRRQHGQDGNVYNQSCWVAETTTDATWSVWKFGQAVYRYKPIGSWTLWYKRSATPAGSLI